MASNSRYKQRPRIWWKTTIRRMYRRQYPGMADEALDLLVLHFTRAFNSLEARTTYDDNRYHSHEIPRGLKAGERDDITDHGLDRSA